MVNSLRSLESNNTILGNCTYFRFPGRGPRVVVFSVHTPGPGDIHVIFVTTDIDQGIERDEMNYQKLRLGEEHVYCSNKCCYQRRIVQF